MFYRCVRSQRIIEVNDPEDIEQMKTNESYIALTGDNNGLQTNEKDAIETPVAEKEVVPTGARRRGRPARVANEVI